MNFEAPAAATDPSRKVCRKWKFAPADFGRNDGSTFKFWLPENEANFPTETLVPPPAFPFTNIEEEFAGWSKLETDTLLELFKQYDGIIPIISDRWPSTLPPRNTLEIKHRLQAMVVSSPPVFDFVSATAHWDALYQLFTTSTNNNTAIQQKKQSLMNTIHTLQQEILTLQCKTAPHVPVKTRLELKAMEDREEEVSTVNCWTRSTLFDPRPHLSGVGKESLSVLYEVLQLLRVPMDPTPTLRICDAHAALKRDTLRLLAFKRQAFKMTQMVKVAMQPLDPCTSPGMVDLTPPTPMKRATSQADNTSSSSKRIRM